MYAVVRTGGKQYRVSPGDTVDVELLPYQEGTQIELGEVLLVANGSGAKIGRPLVEGATVKATVLRQGRHRKVTIYKYHSHHRYRRTKGHRQHYTRLRIDEIVA